MKGAIVSIITVAALSFGAADVEVVDGDTLALRNGEKIRILDLDTPETWKPRCDHELDVGMQAADRLRELLDDGEIRIERVGRDRYGRTLAWVRVDGINVADVLIREGLGLEYRKGSAEKLARIQHWCPGAQLDY